MLRFAPLLLLPLLALPAAAAGKAKPSFDCAKASTAAEKAICADPASADADRAIARSFADGLAAADPTVAKALREDQRYFLDVRDGLAADDGARTAEERREDLRLTLQNRATMLAHLDLRSGSDFTGTWRNTEGAIVIARRADGTYSVSANTAQPYDGRWVCDVEAEGSAQDGEFLATPEGETHWALTAVRHGPMISVEETTTGDESTRHQFCGLNGSFDGDYFHVNEPAQ